MADICNRCAHVDGSGRPVLASVEDGALYASGWQSGAWQPPGGALNQTPVIPSPAAEPAIALSLDQCGEPMQALGLFSDSFAPEGLATMSSMPNPSDTTYSNEARLRAYLHANCSSCHRRPDAAARHVWSRTRWSRP